jgi:Fic family protein
LGSREYEKTHPFLTFQADMRRLSHEVWILLGEAQSKFQHVAGVPLPPARQDELNRVYLAKGALATTAIEGNTLSEDEVKALLDKELHLPPSRQYLAQEVENVVNACNKICDDDSEHFQTITPELIKEFNERVLRDLPLPDEVVPGHLRQHSVTVARYKGAPWRDCPYLLERLCDWLNTGFPSEPGNEHLWAIVKALLAHLYIAWIHPFADGNGRTARLLEFSLLVHAGVPQPAAHLLSNHYNVTRSDYYQQLDLAFRKGGDFVPFVRYAVRGLVDGLREQLEVIRAVQLRYAWRDYVHDFFGDIGASESLTRRQQLLLAMSREIEVTKNRLTHLTPELAAAYAKKTAKTLSRDLHFLLGSQLIELTGPRTYRARSYIMVAFLPRRRTDPWDDLVARPGSITAAPQPARRNQDRR